MATAEPGGAAGRVAGARFIDPAVLARIDNLDLLARTAVDGFLSGLHPARYRGVSTDFAEHRAYSPGDDVRHIDWRVYGRTDRLYLKTFEIETSADLVLALDVSASMDYASGTVSKLDYARFVTASLAHLASRQRDRIGLLTFARDVIDAVPPSTRHRDTVLRTIDRARPAGAGDIRAALRQIALRLRRRGIVVVVSDFYEEPLEVAVALAEMKVQGHDVIAIHVLDPIERDLDLDEPVVLRDLESDAHVPIVPAQVREEYRQLVAAHIEDLARECARRGVEYATFDTSMPLDHVLFRFLSERARLTRVR